MPKIVDHDERRRELAQAAWNVIADSGIDGATTREIAREAGYSTGVLSHYFERKDDILLEALHMSHATIKRRMDDLLGPKVGLEALRAFCYDTVPTSREQARETILEMSFWSRALVNDELRAVQRREAAYWHRLLIKLIVSAQELGELSPGDPEVIADLLGGLIDGLSVHALLYPDRFDEERLTRLIDAQLTLWQPVPAPRRAPADSSSATAGR
jgi:AcrR family transcriptional regulator